MRVKRPSVLGVCVIAILAIFISFSVVPSVSAADKNIDLQKTFKWRGNCFHPAAHAGGRAFKDFCDLVRNMSGGRLDITPYLGGTILKGADSFDGLKNGIVEVAALYSGYHQGKVPETFTESGANGVMPLYLDEHDFWWYEGGANDYMREVYKKYNIYYLGINLAGPIGLMSKVPIRSTDDFKGLKIRTGGSLALVSEALGAKTVNTPIGEAYTALQLGTVDAATYSDLSSFVAMGWHEVAKYAVTGCFKTHGATNISVNLKAWDSLPDDLKAIMLTAGEISCLLHERYEVADNIEAKKIIEKAGGEVIKFSPEEMEKVAIARNKALDALAEKNPRYKEGIELYREFYLKRGYKKNW